MTLDVQGAGQSHLMIFSQATGDGCVQSRPSPSWLGNPEERIETSLARSEKVIREAKVLHPAPPWLAVIFGQPNGGKLQASIDKRLVSATSSQDIAMLQDMRLAPKPYL